MEQAHIPKRIHSNFNSCISNNNNNNSSDSHLNYPRNSSNSLLSSRISCILPMRIDIHQWTKWETKKIFKTPFKRCPKIHSWTIKYQLHKIQQLLRTLMWIHNRLKIFNPTRRSTGKQQKELEISYAVYFLSLIQNIFFIYPFVFLLKLNFHKSNQTFSERWKYLTFYSKQQWSIIATGKH